MKRIDEMTRAERVIAFIETYLKVPDGKFAGQPLTLHVAHKEIIYGIYDANIPVRQAIISVGRKNAKTTLAAMLLLAHLVGPESRFNSQIISGAQSKEQAAIVFKLAAKMVRMSEELHALVTVRDTIKELYCPSTGVLYKALSAEAKTAYGLSPVLNIHDELGQVKGPRSDLYDAMETAMGAHESPLSIVISTQAATDNDLLSTLIDDAQAKNDPSTKVFLYSADKELDILDPVAWKQANPALGDFLNENEIRLAAEKAKRMPSAEATFRNLHLNQRVATTNSFIPRDVWLANCNVPDASAFEDYIVYAGLDLSARQDLTALIAIAIDPLGNVHVESEFFAPEEGLKDRAARDRVEYDVWADQGFLTLTPGRSVDYATVAKSIARLMTRCPHLTGIAYDRWRIDVLKQALRDNDVLNVPLVPFGQGFKDMAPAVDAIETALLSAQVRHGGNPILTWCAANTVTSRDAAGNRKLDKSKTSGRIDGLVALTMGYGIYTRGLNTGEVVPPSPWDADSQYKLEMV